MLVLWTWMLFCTLVAAQVQTVEQAVAALRFFVFTLAIRIMLECWRQYLFAPQALGRCSRSHRRHCIMVRECGAFMPDRGLAAARFAVRVRPSHLCAPVRRGFFTVLSPHVLGPSGRPV